MCCFVHLRRRANKDEKAFSKNPSKKNGPLSTNLLKRRKSVVEAVPAENSMTAGAPSHSEPNLLIPEERPPPPPNNYSKSVTDLQDKQTKAKRFYDGSYSTGEPLEGAPRNDAFEDKDWNMDGDVNPGSLHSLNQPQLAYSKAPTLPKQNNPLQTDIY